MRRNLNARQAIKNIANRDPKRKIMGPDGVMIVEKLCPIPHNRKMISPQGDAVTVALGTGYTSHRTEQHGIQKYQEKLDAGFLPYDECPIRSTHPLVMSMGLKGEPCDPKTISNAQACKHLVKIAEARQAAEREKQHEFVSSFNSESSRMLALMEKQMKFQTEAGADKAPAKAKMGV